VINVKVCALRRSPCSLAIRGAVAVISLRPMFAES
jgi:hypothetical protein